MFGKFFLDVLNLPEVLFAVLLDGFEDAAEHLLQWCLVLITLVVQLYGVLVFRREPVDAVWGVQLGDDFTLYKCSVGKEF